MTPATGQEVHQLGARDGAVSGQRHERVHSLAYSSSGTPIAAASSTERVGQSVATLVEWSSMPPTRP